MQTATAALLNGYRGTKVHAVAATDQDEAMSLCGWRVTVGATEFTELPGLTCKVCAKAAR